VWRSQAWEALCRRQEDQEALTRFLAAPSSEAAGEIITALATGGSYAGIMNLPNTGQVPSLPAGAVVETLGEIAAGAVRGFHTGELPAAIAALLQRHVANQELTVAAALEGNRGLVRQALLGDPLCPPDVELAEHMLEEMLAANRSHLPQFF
jgi:alpha-galactosidase/6-phospho-beta-glucosidase family protein